MIKLDNMIKVLMVGAQGTGKTTVLNWFKENTNLTPITEVVRNLVKEGKVKANEEGDEESQNIIFNEYLHLLNQDIEYISDRSLIDVLSYTSYLYDNGKINITSNIVEIQIKKLIDFLVRNKNIIICYFPIEFDVVNDGFRSTSEEFRKRVDKNIKTILDDYVHDYITIHGTVEERVKQIMDRIDNNIIDNFANIRDIKEDNSKVIQLH